MLGERLKEQRIHKKLRQEDVAAKIGIARTTYAMYEQNKREPDNETLQKLADFFDVRIDYLLGRVDDPFSFDKRENQDELTTIMYHKWDQLDERRRKQALKLIEILEQEADEENRKK